MTSKKIYVQIARAIRDATTSGIPPTLNKNAVVVTLCDIFQRDNPRFNACKFIEACRGETRSPIDS